MTSKRYRVKLTAEEREELKALTTKGGYQHGSRRMGVFCCSAMNVGRMADGRTVRLRRLWALGYRRWCECIGVVWRRDWRRL